MLSRRRDETGAVLALVAVSLTVLLGVAAMAIDVGNFRAHRRQLQSAADAGALAGAAQLIQGPAGVCGSGSASDYYERQNSDLTGAKNLIKNANLDTSFCDIPAGTDSVRVQPSESDVPWWFGRVLGFGSDTINARARAQVVYLTSAKGLAPIGVENLQPATVVARVNGATYPLGNSGCTPITTTEGFPFWCGAMPITAALPAGGAPVTVEVTDASGKVISFPDVGWIGSNKDVPGCVGAAGGACVAEDVTIKPITDPFIYYTSTTSPKTFGVQAHLTNLPANTTDVQVTYDGTTKTIPLANVNGSLADGTWNTATNAFTSDTGGGAKGITVTVVTSSGTCKKGCDADNVQQAYARSDSALLQQYSQSTNYVDNGWAAGDVRRTIVLNVAFQVLVKGKVITLALAGGQANGQQGNYDKLDLDANRTLRQEIATGAQTPYAIGDSVPTQTGVSAGQVDQGLDDRIGGSPSHYAGQAVPDPLSDPPPPGDPRWVALLLVQPLAYQDINGTKPVLVTGFGNFYITAYHTDDSTLQQGSVRGFYWDRVNPSGPYDTSCHQNICLKAVALMPWDG
jgi:hypothetical protein